MSPRRLTIGIVWLGLLTIHCAVANASGDGKKPSSPPVTESPIQLSIPAGTLYGSLDLPPGDGPFPIVLSIAGSGPTDRDGNQPGMKNNGLKLLGQGLAAKGIAVLRYDRRGVGQSKKAAPREENFRFEMLTDDAVAWVKLLRKDKRFSRVGIIGHSEGALVGMLAARRAPADAFVSLAGVGRKPHLVLREQLAKNLPARLNEKSGRIIDELVAGRPVPDVPKELAGLFRPSVQPFLIAECKLDPAEEMARLKMPVLIVQGTTDLQVAVVDAKTLAAAKKDAKLLLLDGMNHVLRKASSQWQQLRSYYDSSQPLMPGLTEEVVAFLREALARPY